MWFSNNINIKTLIKMKKQTLFAFLAFAFAFCGLHLHAAEIGGAIRDAKTGYFLEDVEVGVNDSRQATLTDREGNFTLSGLEAGEYKITFTYPGMASHVETVALADAGARRTLNIALKAADDDVVVLEKYVVAGVKEGQAASIARQKAADNIQVVISMDAHGDVADGNIGNFLQRLAGVTVTKDAGDITNITLRGSPAGSSAISMDGNQMPTDDNRATRVDYIPSEFIKEIEVIKGSTPDMWADGLTGTVNLITKSAFDYRTAVANYSAGVSANTYRSDLWEWGPFASFTYMNVLGKDRKLGVSLSGSYNKSVRPRDWVQIARRYAGDGRVTQARLLDDVVYRERSGANLKMEYRPSRTFSIRINAGWNRYKQWSDRNNFNVAPLNGEATVGVADYSKIDRTQIEAGTVPKTENNTTAGIAPGFTDAYTEILHATVSNQAAIGIGNNDVYRYGIELIKRLPGGVRWDFCIFGTESKSTSEWWTLTATRRGGMGMAVDTSLDPKRPIFTQTYGATADYGADYSKFDGRVDLRNSPSTSTINTISTNLTKDIGWRIPVRIKAGLAMRLQERDAVQTLYRWTYKKDMSHYVSPERAYGLFNGAYDGKDHLDIHMAIRELYAPATSGDYALASGYGVSPPESHITEDVYVGYIMSSFRAFGTIVTGGVRGEWTAIDSRGPITDPRNPNQSVTTAKSDYMQAFPSVHLKYPLGNFVARASYSTSMARPPISRLVPSTTINIMGDEEGQSTITENNVGLRPQFSKNWDLSIEYYLKSSGIISVGWFRKDIRDFITQTSWIVPEGEEYAGFRKNTWVNVGKAKIDGYELEYSQRFSFLPKPFNGISMFVNYTHLKTAGEYNDGLAELVNFVPKTYNAGLTWRWWKLEARAQYRYQSGMMIQYSEDPTLKNRQTADDTLDINLRFSMKPWMTFYVDLQNILNEAPFWYNISRDRVIKSEATGMQLTIGVSGRF